MNVPSAVGVKVVERRSCVARSCAVGYLMTLGVRARQRARR